MHIKKMYGPALCESPYQLPVYCAAALRTETASRKGM